MNAVSLSLDAFELEGYLVGGPGCGGDVLAILYDEVLGGREGAMAELLERTAAVLRLHDLDFDGYAAARARVDPRFAARLSEILDLDLGVELVPDAVV